MEYKLEKNKIVIENIEEFCPQHILECGQIFSYIKTEKGYKVFSGEYMAEILKHENGYVIQTKNPKYFVNFFDLNTNYTSIKKELKETNEFLKNAIGFGEGIRILNQDFLETIISFIVSANNNIKRIQKILFQMREKFGKNMGEYYAFPTLEELKMASVQDFKDMGAGYRAEYIYKTVRMLEGEDYASWKNLPTGVLSKKLTSLMGVGQKVADCIMLFAYGKKDVFPVDTWIHQVYNQYFEKEENRLKIRNNLIQTYGGLSGYAQQYFFYSQRSGEK